RRHTRFSRDWSSDVCSSDLVAPDGVGLAEFRAVVVEHLLRHRGLPADPGDVLATGGSTAAVGELARTLPPGGRVAVEEPGYQRRSEERRVGKERRAPVRPHA